MKKHLKTIALAMLIGMSMQTAAEAAGWAAMRWAQCYRLGGSYCR